MVADDGAQACRLPSPFCNAALCKHAHPPHHGIASSVWDIHLAGQMLKAPADARELLRSALAMHRTAQADIQHFWRCVHRSGDQYADWGAARVAL